MAEANDVEVRRLRLQPGDSLVLVGPAGAETRSAGRKLRSALDELGHAETSVLVIAGDYSLYVLPGGEEVPAASPGA